MSARGTHRWLIGDRRLPTALLAFGVVLLGLGAPHPTAVAAATQSAKASAVPGAPPGAALCTSLGTVALPQTTLTATYADATTAGGTGRGALPALPAHCVVHGVIAPRTGVDGRHYETRFELRLPTAWSGRFLYQGGGGNDGNVAPAVGRNTGSFPETALQRGLAVVSTDAGHQGGGAEFGLDPDARIDHAYRAHDRVATTAKAVIARYYGRGPSKSYFVGCSGGGRQGMMFAQRFPDYFDGISICAPAMSVSSGATIAAAWDTATYLSIAPNDGEGRRVLSQALSPADLELVSHAVLTTCDADDGVADGMVQRAGRCRFDPATLQCPGAKTPSCLSARQVSALTRAFAGPVDSSGRRLYVGQAWDPGISAPGWRQWKLGSSETATPNAMNTTLMAGALAYEFLTPPDPAFRFATFDVERDPARMTAFSEVYDTFRDATLRAFSSRGGKLLIFHGMADGIFSPLESIDYYERLAGNHGGVERAQTWARLFLVPGMNHCAGGPATDSFDGLAALVDWVEEGRAPEQILAAALPASRAFPNRTRPLCSFPSYARYSGSGDVERAESFQCTK